MPIVYCMDLTINPVGFDSSSISAPFVIFIVDEGGRICFWNQAAERLFGYSRHEAQDQDLQALLAPGICRTAFLQWLRATGSDVFGSALNQTANLTGRRRDGTEFPVNISLVGVKLDNRGYAVGVLCEIPARKHMGTRPVQEACPPAKARRGDSPDDPSVAVLWP